MKTRLAIPVIILLLGGCVENETFVESYTVDALTWELMEIKPNGLDWRPVTAEQKHYLSFYSETDVEYTGAREACTGEYLFEELQNSNVSNRLVLHVPCMVPAQQLYFEHLIESRTGEEVVTLPCLSPTAQVCADRYKYRILHPPAQE